MYEIMKNNDISCKTVKHNEKVTKIMNMKKQPRKMMKTLDNCKKIMECHEHEREYDEDMSRSMKIAES